MNGANAANVYWVNGSTFTSVDGGTSNMVGSVLAHTSVTLGGGTLRGRALANTGAVTLSTTETITSPSGSSSGVGYNAVVYNNVTGSPAWFRPSPLGKSYSRNMAPCSVDDTDSNPWTVRGLAAGQSVVEFQVPTFLNQEGQAYVDNLNRQNDEQYIDTISAQLVVTCTGGTS